MGFGTAAACLVAFSISIIFWKSPPPFSSKKSTAATLGLNEVAYFSEVPGVALLALFQMSVSWDLVLITLGFNTTIS